MTSGCSIADLELGLAGDLPADREELLHRHLEGCEACSAALEEMAGGKAWCDKAAALLASDDLDEAVPSREEWSSVDFSVEHLEPSDEPNVLGRLGGYDVLEIIGRGGMGVVLKGFDRELKRCVAIKVLAPHLAQSSLAKKRFAREAQATAAVLHPNVLAIHQVQAGGRLPFLVMPLVAGESLAQRLTAQGRLELKEILRIGMQAAAGLAAAHEQGLVHRDVKPANILLEKGVERAVLTDFGLARAADDVSMTRWGVIAGTPQYMSPEQARGEPLDGRSDLFSLGCVLYEMATGVSPFRSDSTMATLRRLIDDAPPAMASLNPELPPWFVGIVERLLEKDPARRFGSAKEVSELLEGCLAHLQQPASVPLPAGCVTDRNPKRKRGLLASPFSLLAYASGYDKRRSFFIGTIAVIATLGIGLLGMFLVQSTEPPDIGGQWSGHGWGQVVLTQTAAGEYTGKYSETVGKAPGKIELKWSRIERRFNGKWSEGSEGQDRFGELSVRLAGDEIRGALTTDVKSKINPAAPRLADLTWTRRGSPSGKDRFQAGGDLSNPVSNLITNNAGFESPVAGKNSMRPANWNYWGSVYLSPQYAYSGSQSLVVSGQNSGAYQSFTVTPGASYTMSVYAMMPAGNPLTGNLYAELQLLYFDSRGDQISPYTRRTRSSFWTVPVRRAGRCPAAWATRAGTTSTRRRSPPPTQSRRTCNWQLTWPAAIMAGPPISTPSPSAPLPLTPHLRPSRPSTPPKPRSTRQFGPSTSACRSRRQTPSA